MPQPSFWLKVSKKYVVENFESLLEYIKDYNYSPSGDGQGDFGESVRCLAETASDFAAQCRQAKIWEHPQLEVDADTAVRLMAASVLARRKMGVDDHEGILNLIEVLLASGQQLAPDVAASLLRLAIDCMCRRPIESLGFSFVQILPARFIPATLPSLLAATKIGKDPGRKAEFEGKGCLEVSADGIIAAPMNLDSFRRAKCKPALDDAELVRIVEQDAKHLSEVEELLLYYPRLSSALERVRHSRPKVKPEFSIGARMIAEVVFANGYTVRVRTVSPDYKSIEGKLDIPPKFFYYVPRRAFLAQVQVGDVLKVERIERDEYLFTLVDDDFSDFVADYGGEMQGEDVWAVFMSHFRTGIGTRWLTEDGLQVNVGWSVPDGITTEVGAPEKVALTMKELSTDNSGKKILNAAFSEYGDVNVEACNVSRFEEDAYEEFCGRYLEWSKDINGVAIKQDVELDRLESGDVVVAGRLLAVMADAPNISTSKRLERLTMAMTLLKMAGRADADAYVRHRLDYIRAIAGFASGASPMSLMLRRPDELEEVEDSRLRDLVVESLRGYKEQEITHADSTAGRVPGGRHIDAGTPELIRQLVDASNILIDKIDGAEIQRIKKTISSRLGVADCYRFAYSDLPYYGDETETLELKQSCTMPPQNRRSTSAVKNLEMQKYAILKGVCAFLNASQSGDLIVGVSDTGYAVGLKDDIDRLYSAHIISEPNADRLRLYMKNAIDKAFTTLDGSMGGPAITADYVSCDIERAGDNIEVLRIHVKPFPWGVVKFAAPAGSRPDGFADVYCRTSGASTPMAPDAVRTIRMRKKKALGNEDAKMLPIMEAIDEHRCVQLRGYASSYGTSDHKVEPHRILFDLKAVQAFDLKSRSMMLFKLNRIDAVERTSDRWKNESLHRDLDVDIFGMMQSEETPGEMVTVKLTDYALSLLREEFPAVDSKARIEPNGDADRNRFARRLSTEIFSPQGIGRFILGLRREIEIVEGPTLKDYIAKY